MPFFQLVGRWAKPTLGIKYFGSPVLDRILHGTPAHVGGYPILVVKVTIVRVTRPGERFLFAPSLATMQQNVAKSSEFWSQYGIRIRVVQAVEEMREEYYKPTIGSAGEGSLNDAVGEFADKYRGTVIVMGVGGWSGPGEDATNGATAKSRRGYGVSVLAASTHTHEFGHVIWGLDHVDGVRNNIMYVFISVNANSIIQAFASQRQVDAARRYLLGQDYVE